MLNELKKQLESMSILIDNEKKIKEQYQNENDIIKNSEIELKEKINTYNREINI